MRRVARKSVRTGDVEQTTLPPSTLAVWLRIGVSERIAVADSVPLGAVAGIVRHLRSHASIDLAGALGLVSCVTEECSIARSWLSPVVVSAVTAV